MNDMNDHFHNLLNIADSRAELQSQKLARQSILKASVSRSTAVVPLLVHEEPMPSENIESFLFRSAAQNALKSASELQRVLNLPKSKAFSRKRHEQLSSSLGSELDAVAATVPTNICDKFVLYGQHQLPKYHLALSTSRLCPSCIAADAYGKLHWNLAPVAVCEQHGIYLIDHCTCNPLAALNTSRPGYAICRCGMDLRHAETHVARASAQMLSNEIFRLFNASSDSAESVIGVQQWIVPRETNLCGLLDLIVFLGGLDANPKAMNLSFARPLVRMAPVIEQFNQAADALFDWPNGMFSLFRSVGRKTAKGKGMAKAYDGLRHTTIAAERSLPHHLNKWFLDVIALYLATPSAWISNPVRHP